MSEKREFLSKRALIIIGIVSIIVLLLGIILILAGLNNSFYASQSSIQAIFKGITYLGEPIVFIIITSILYFGYNKKFAKNLVLSLLIATYLNQLFKSIFQDPRPAANIDATEDYGMVETSYGFPSGHTQTAVAFWGYLGCEFKDNTTYKLKNFTIPIVPVILSAIIFLVSISRIIVGVHDLQDIVGGFLIGISVLLLFMYLEPVVSDKFTNLSFNFKIILIVTVSISMFLVGTLLFPNAGLGLVTNPVLFPDSGAFGLFGGVILGFGIGYILEGEYIKYDPSSLSKKKRLINVVLGIVFLLAVFVPFEYLLKIDSVFYRFARYGLASFVLAFIVPLVFKKIN
ncbi:hypothetical protein LCGC14_1167590 [marine sediment metagenome]|uniref:Phosphatidic acid phosphatase type 2/haloperoxidase domain-containing protein n=1 Tax=marine sediment metagenome TaxID=412755 RepID=A0A0F9LQX3_9ZZZZ|nr:phosphatase PAP2 family protein [archaeon]